MIGRHPRSRVLMQFHDGELGPARAEDVSTHVATCERCRSTLAEFASVGAVVRGEVVPAALAPAARHRVELAGLTARLAPALAAAALVAAIVIVNDPQPDRQVAAGDAARVEDVTLPSVDAGDSPASTGLGAGNADSSSTTGRGASAPSTQSPGGGSPSSPAPSTPAGKTITLGVLAPGGQTGAGEPVVRAVAVALAQANAAGGVQGNRLELVVADSTDPGASAALAERGVRAVVGGHGAPAPTYQALAARGMAWFGPADVAPGTYPNVVPVEVGHRTAGQILAKSLTGAGYDKVFAVASPTEERRLADGLATSMSVHRAEIAGGTPCGQVLQQGPLSGADVLALALDGDGVRACLEAVTANYPIREIVIPSTTVDDALAALPDGFGLSATLGLPGPDDAGPGPTRFRASTGVQRHYRAMTSFAAAEMAVDALRRNPEQPLTGFMKGGVFRSDLLTLNPDASPMNVAVQVVRLAEFQVGAQPPPGQYSQQSQGAGAFGALGP